MFIPWLDFILSRRYALTVSGDPIPARPTAPLLAAGTATESAGPATKGGASDGEKSDKTPAVPRAAHEHGVTAGHDVGAARATAAPNIPNTPDGEADFDAHNNAASAAQQDAGPFLILPNNPSLIDPLLLYAHVAALKPLVVLRQEQSPALRMFAGAADIVILPPAHATPQKAENTDAGDRADSADSPSNTPGHADTDALPYAKSEDEKATSAALLRVADALAQGRSVVLWPSPHVQHTGYECVPPHNPAFSLLQLLSARGQALPELFLVRAEGLWGSSFSWYKGCAPSFGGSLWAQVPAIFLGPFLQRRPVRLVMRRHALRQTPEQRPFQAMLNAWFGAGHESAVMVPRFPLCRTRSMPLEILPQDEACAAVHAAMQAGTSAAPQISSPLPEAPQPESTQAASPRPEAPQLESMESVCVQPMAAQHAEAVPAPDPAAQVPLGQPAHADAQQVSKMPLTANPTETPPANTAQAPAVPNTPLADLNPAVPRTPPLLPVQHALTRQGSVTDASYGQHFSRRTLLGLAKAIGTLLGPVPATRIGMSLPCGTGALATYIAILDCTLETDRIPVLLDPNMSPEQLAQCAQETGITHVVTSRSFNGRGLPPNTLPVYLEDITPAQLMRGSALSFMGFAGTTEVDSLAAIICSPAALPANGHVSAEQFPSNARADVQPLFLQHQELMEALHNLVAHLSAPPLNVHSLSILGCLPPHSPLGLLVNVVLPLTCGVPIVTVNATHNTTVLARSAENYSVNFFAGSPANMTQLLHEARSHLPFRYVLLSQEPCPPELLALIPKACPHACIFSADRHGNIVLL